MAIKCFYAKTSQTGARLDATGTLHHVMGRWIEGTKIFKFIQKQPRSSNMRKSRLLVNFFFVEPYE
jgi:hypothetical protein